jgi:hypothetical protein
VFLEWWKPQKFDWYVWDINGFCKIGAVYKFKKDNILPYPGRPDIWQKKNQCIPLLTEGQLRQFIEDKTGCVLNIEYENYQDGKWDLYFTVWKYKTGGTTREIKSHMVYGCKSILEGYWKVALGLTKESVDND